MMVIEMREAAYDKAFDLLDEIKDLGKKKRMAVCELEDTLYDCFESYKDEDSDSENTDYEMPDGDISEEPEVDFRKRGTSRMSRYMRSMRHHDDGDIRMRRMHRMHSRRMA